MRCPPREAQNVPVHETPLPPPDGSHTLYLRDTQREALWGVSCHPHAHSLCCDFHY